MRDPENDKMLDNAIFVLRLFTDKSISDKATMATVREQCMEVMTQDDIEKAAAFLKSGEAAEYLRSLADQ